jgi:hypothetical protein
VIFHSYVKLLEGNQRYIGISWGSNGDLMRKTHGDTKGYNLPG